MTRHGNRHLQPAHRRPGHRSRGSRARRAAGAIATAIAHGDERAATKADLAGTEQALGARIDAVRSELGILRWVGGIESTVTLATFAIVAAKLLRASGPALPASAIW